VALNDMTNLKLGQLGHIAGGNANNTTQTSLASTCRGSSSATSMRGDFRIGSTTFTNDSGVFDGEAKGYFKCKVRNDVGEYMGGGQSGEDVSDSLKVGINDSNTYIFHIEETNDGSLYESRIAQRSTNAVDYNGEFELTHGSAGFAISNPYADTDKIRFFGT
tara:strand:- start:48 stop:533 length:486 start_codon:yes stop_codon:yes gene_type:complete